jgi:hypothetical protein
MGLSLLLSALLFQAAPPAAKPIIDNEHATVWDMTGPVGARPGDAVIVSLAGSSKFVPKGTTLKTSGRNIVIDLKEHPATPIPNTSGLPLAFPRPGSKKLFENARVILWDYSWKPGEATPMHFHDKDVVVVYLEDGDLQSTTPDGKTVVNPYKFGMVKYNLRDRVHSELLIRGKQRALITEFK